MIDRYHLRYFLAVVDTGGFSRAAAACNVSQPTLSVGIGKLEQALGRPLFNRSNRRVALTEAGSRLLAYARSIEAGFAAAEREVAAATSTRPFRLGVIATAPRRWIEDFLRRRTALPGRTDVELVEGNERDLRSRLARGRIDAALTILRDDGDRNTGLSILTEPYSLALGAEHRLAGEASIGVEDLADEKMIVRRHCEGLAETSRFFTAHGIRPVFPAKTISDDKALAYVRAGLAITVMPDGFREAGVVRRPLRDFPLAREIGLIFAPHSDAESLIGSPAVTALVEAVRGARSGEPS